MTTSVIAGIISKKSRKKRTTPWGEKWATSFQINGDWYSGGFKDYPHVNEGDEVQCTWEQNDKGYKDIKAISVTGKGVGEPGTPEAGIVPVHTGPARSGGRTFPVDPLAPERTINRQNALTNAVAFCSAKDGFDATIEDVITIAREFEAYTCGDIDREEAEAMMSAEE